MSNYDELFYSSFEYKTSQLFASFVELGTGLCFSLRNHYYLPANTSTDSSICDFQTGQFKMRPITGPITGEL